LKGQFEQKKQNNSMEDTSSPQGDVLENGADSNIMDIQSKEMPALSIRFRVKVFETFLQLKKSKKKKDFLTGMVHSSRKYDSHPHV